MTLILDLLRSNSYCGMSVGIVAATISCPREIDVASLILPVWIVVE